MKFAALFWLTLSACGTSARPPAVMAEAPASFQPCALEAGVLELPVGEDFVLAASEGACLLIDESRDATFISIAELRDDEEGFALLQEDLRAFVRASGLLGQTPQFTGRGQARVLEQDAEVHTFVATPEGLPERAGFVLRAPAAGGAILFVGFSGTPSEAATLQLSLATARLRTPN